jgi:hypothetical protein
MSSNDRTTTGLRRRSADRELEQMWSVVNFLKAVLVGEAADQHGGLRKDVTDLKASSQANRRLLWITLGTLLTSLILHLFKFL